jgi:hypothetical protein
MRRVAASSAASAASAASAVLARYEASIAAGTIRDDPRQRTLVNQVRDSHALAAPILRRELRLLVVLFFRDHESIM